MVRVQNFLGFLGTDGVALLASLCAAPIEADGVTHDFFNHFRAVWAAAEESVIGADIVPFFCFFQDVSLTDVGNAPVV